MTALTVEANAGFVFVGLYNGLILGFHEQHKVELTLEGHTGMVTQISIFVFNIFFHKASNPGKILK